MVGFSDGTSFRSDDPLRHIRANSESSRNIGEENARAYGAVVRNRITEESEWEKRFEKKTFVFASRGS